MVTPTDTNVNPLVSLGVATPYYDPELISTHHKIPDSVGPGTILVLGTTQFNIFEVDQRLFLS